MTRYYRRKKPGPGENLRAGLVAGALATSVAAVSFYLVRIFLSREPLEPTGVKGRPEDSPVGSGEDED
jgi:hypothetical protein